MKAYLAGAIDRVGIDYAREWREEAKNLLEQHTELGWYDPLEYEFEAQSDAEVINRDLALIRRAAVLIVDGRQPGWGSAMEVREAWRQSIPVIVWGIPREKAPMWLRHHASVIVPRLADAVMEAAALA